MAFIYNEQAPGDVASSSKINALSAATGRITDVGLYPVKSPRYIIIPEDGGYHAFDGLTGVKADGGASAHTLINWALNNLTAGRTWIEEVLCNGDFTITDTLEIPSLARLKIQGAVTAETGMTNSMVENTDPATGNTDVELVGGYFDVNSNAITYPLHFRQLTRFRFERPFIYNGGIHGIWCTGSAYGTVIAPTLLDRVGDGVTFTSYGIDGAAIPSHDISVWGAKAINVNNCFLALATSYNIHYTDCTSFKGANSLTLVDFSGGRKCTATNVSGSGKLYTRSYTPGGWGIVATAYENIWTGCEAIHAGAGANDYSEIRGDRCQMIGGRIEGGTRGLAISGASDCLVQGVEIKDVPGYAFQNWAFYYDNARNAFLNNKVINCTSGFLEDAQPGNTTSFGKYFDNDLTGATTKYALGASGGTVSNQVLRSVIVPFDDGTARVPSGWDIDAGTEYAWALTRIPQWVQYCLQMRILARSMVLEADAMLIELTVKAGAPGEQYNLINYNVADLASTTTNFAADDVIEWVVNNATIHGLEALDSLEVEVLHEAAAGADAATDARFRTVEIECF